MRRELSTDQVTFQAKLREYNQYYEKVSPMSVIQERNEVLEGPLRVYWGVSDLLKLKEDEDSRLIRRKARIRHSVSQLRDSSSSPSPDRRPVKSKSLDDETNSTDGMSGSPQCNEVFPSEPAVTVTDNDTQEPPRNNRSERARTLRRSKLRRKCSINGHYYDRKVRNEKFNKFFLTFKLFLS